jgi:uracil-DNA glycosylase
MIKTWADLPIWQSLLIPKLKKHCLTLQAEGKAIRPGWKMAWRPLMATRLDQVRVVLLDREPSYELKAVPDGFAFSDSGPLVNLANAPYKSKVILSALASDPETRHLPPAPHFCLRNWAKQGVLLLNTIPISQMDSPMRLLGMGFEDISRAILRAVLVTNPKCVFVVHDGIPTLFRDILKEESAIVITPPVFPLYVGSGLKSFCDFRMFSKINNTLRDMNEPPVNWTVK